MGQWPAQHGPYCGIDDGFRVLSRAVAGRGQQEEATRRTLRYLIPLILLRHGTPHCTTVCRIWSSCGQSTGVQYLAQSLCSSDLFLGSKSAKNDVRLQPLRTINDVLNTITDSKDVLGWAEKDTGERYMVLLPWNSTITADNEYRVFQRNGLPTAISQQKWYRDLGFEITDAELAACVTELCQRLSRHPGWYAACCLDVYVRRGAQGAWRAYVIEANPWGEAFSSGSSLFDWIAHQKALRDSTCVTIAKRQRR